MEYPQKHLNELCRRIQQYDQSILDIEENGADPSVVRNSWMEPWRSYIINDCRLCNTKANKDLDTDYCRDCVIGSSRATTTCYCIDEGRGLATRDAMVDSTPATFLKALKARRSWLLKQAEKNGIVLVDK